jgi:hypothetical protein
MTTKTTTAAPDNNKTNNNRLKQIDRKKLEANVASCEAEIEGVDEKIQALIRKVDVDDVDAYSKIRLLQAAQSLMQKEISSLKEVLKE